jgi:flagellar hook assembly protein FlgD
VVTHVKTPAPPQKIEPELINYPNPFNASTNFFVKIPGQLNGSRGNILIYNSRGQFVKDILLNENGRSNWDGTNAKGRAMPSGIYHYQLNIGQQVVKRGSMILLK